MLAYDNRDDYEIIEGEKFMAPSPFKRHGKIVSRLMFTIGTYAFINKLGSAFADNFDVNLPDGNVLRPDFIFIGAANDNIVFDNEDENFHGVPDMVAEIFSRSTMKRDMTIKKDIYERNGVKEYWIINPWSESIEVYLLHDGKYVLDNVYPNYSDNDLANLTDKERSEVQMEVPVAVLDGFKVKIRNIFGWYFE